MKNRYLGFLTNKLLILQRELEQHELSSNANMVGLRQAVYITEGYEIKMKINYLKELIEEIENLEE